MKEIKEARQRDIMSLQTGSFKAVNMTSLSKCIYTCYKTPVKIHLDFKKQIQARLF